GAAIGGASLSLPADPTAGLRGDAALAVPLTELASSTLYASGPVGFGATGLEADLELRLAGPLEALGRLTADAEAIRARLSGPGLALTAELRGALGEARLELRELPLDEALPFLRAPRLTADADVAWDDASWSWRVEALRLTTPGGLLEAGGVGGPNGRVAASARVDVDLRDLLLDSVAAGRVHGPLSFDGELGDPLAGTIAANLEAEDVRWAGLAATWQAALTVTGRAGDPLVRADWTATGPDARLGGDAAWWPLRAAGELRADGDLFGARLALDVGLAQERFSGGGEVGLGGETWRVTTDAGRLAIVGGGRWRDWSVAIDPADWRADVAGDLAALPGAGGNVTGTIGLGAARRPVVDLAWRAASVAGLELGDGRVTGDAVAGWAVTGTHATGSLDPDLRRWFLALDGVATPVGDTSASFLARGEPDGIELAATWVGDTPAGPLDLRIDAAGEADRWRGEVTGRAFAGEVAWPLALDGDALTGRGRLAGASVAGTTFDAELTLAGTLAEPELAIGVEAGPDEAWRVDAGWRAGVARVEASLPHAEGAPLLVRGEVWPQIDVVVEGDDAGVARLTGGWRSGALRIDGALAVDLGDLRIEVAGPSTLSVLLPALGGGLSATLPAAPLLDAAAEVADGGWWWHGTGAWTGSLRALGPGDAWLVADGVSFPWGGVVATVDGRVDGVDDASLDLRLDLSRLADGYAFAGAWPWSRPAVASLRWRDGVASLVGEAPWGVDATLDLDSRTVAVALDVAGIATGDRRPPSAEGRLTLDPDGWGGALRVVTVTDALGDGPATVELAIAGAGPHLALDASVLGTRGGATVVGRWDAAALLPGGWGPATVPVRELDARVVGLDLTGIAGVPGISGDLGGSATLRGDRLFGLLASEALTYGGRTDPARLEFQADLAGATGLSGSGRLELAGASAQFDVGPAGVSTLVRLERFPLHAWVEAVVGPSDVRAEVTGAVRGTWAWGGAAPDDLRVAAERIELERAGVVTIGELSLDWDGDALTIGRAAFEGRGTWQARGRVTPELLDLELLAQAADFGPLLGLVPSLARYGVSAEGDLVVTAHGTPASPDVALRTDDLRLLVAGTSYQLLETRFTLRDEDWSGRAEIVALEPLTGRLELATSGRVGPFPEGGFGLQARAVGELDVPFVGRVEAITAELEWSDEVAPTLTASGMLGAPFTLAGPLAPLDLRASGRGLTVTLPFLAIADARLDVDLRLADDGDGVRLGGRVDASEARVDLATRAAFATRAPIAVTVDGDAPAPRAAAPTPVGDPRERFRFDGVRIVAPQRVTFNESFGNAEASVDLTLGGTAAAPRLGGEVAALRGVVRFGGRDLELTEAVATFDPTRGVYPAVRVAGRTAFEKSRVVPSGGAVRFLAPAGQRFEVVLVLEGVAIDGATGFTLDLTPVLTSDAVVEGLDGGGARALSELELLTLLTLGRLEAGGGFAGAVAQSALDTAVDVLITGEIQAALSEALGGAVVELRTTALSSLIDGQDPFGVSLRLGGYLSDEVFASYRVSTLGGDAFSNEVALSYQLGPVAMDVTGRFDVAAGAAATGGPSLAIGGRYGLAPGWALELGLDLSSERSTARLGVTWRW
ncbi:MAG: translocation/assembly module TamB, partial [Trueperaceae bacterium]|nr:translocation/assembly module TamB [Trueperaceae bacterium]